MEDIKRVKLSEIVELITKGTTPTTLGYEFQDEGVNFLKIECFDENGGFIESKVAHISEECHKKMKRSQLKNGDILFSIAGAIGRVAIVTEEMLPANINQALAIIRISDEQVYLPYIKLILTSPIVIEQFERKKQGVAQLNLSLKDINEISIPLPSKDKQIELAELFDKVVGVISKRNKELSALDDLIKARFVEMFGDPATNPFNWDKINISEVVGDKVSNGFFAKRDDYADDGNVSVMGVAYIVNRMYSQWQDLPRTNGTDKDIEKFEVKYGDMLFCRSSLVAEGIGKASIVPEDVPQNTLFECHVIRLPLDLSKCVPEYMQVFSTMEYFRRQIIAQSKTATMTTIGQDGILKADILLPPMSKQREFYAFVHQVNKSKFDTMTFAPIYAIINLYLHTYFYQGRR